MTDWVVHPHGPLTELAPGLWCHHTHTSVVSANTPETPIRTSARTVRFAGDAAGHGIFASACQFSRTSVAHL